MAATMLLILRSAGVLANHRGNFPQAYSHVGLIHAAFAASPSWADVL
jgi:hypothetical protein